MRGVYVETYVEVGHFHGQDIIIRGHFWSRLYVYDIASGSGTRQPVAYVSQVRQSTRESCFACGLPILAPDKSRAKQVLLTRGGHLYSGQMDKNTPLCRGRFCTKGPVNVGRDVAKVRK